MKKLAPIILLLTTVAAYAGLSSVDWRFGTLRDSHIYATLNWYGLAFAAFILLVIWAERQGKVNLRYVWAVAVIARILLLTTTPTLSDDIYRYLWDGYVATQGVSPYALAIDSAEHDPYHHPVRDLANNTWMASPYMPVAQTIFNTSARLLPLVPLTLQILMVAFDLLTAWLISKLLAIANLPPHRIILYLLNPLIIIEIAHSGHIDAWMILLTFAAIYFTLKNVSFPRTRESSVPTLANENDPTKALTPNPTPKLGEGNQRRLSPQSHSKTTVSGQGLPSPAAGEGSGVRALLAPILLALAVLTKIIPVLAAPIFFWHWNWKQRIGSALLAIALLLPAGQRAGWGLSSDLNGEGLFGALRIYADRWHFNSGIFYWLREALGGRESVAADQQAKLIVWLIMMVILLIVWGLAYRNRFPRAVLRLMIIPFAAYLSLTPTVNPWYALLMLSFVPFLAPAADESPWRWLTTTPFLYLAATLPLSYITYRDPNDLREFEWIRQTEWLPTLVLVLIAILWLTTTHLRTKAPTHPVLPNE